jgi:tRNA(Ile)-lysidine synthase
MSRVALVEALRASLGETFDGAAGQGEGVVAVATSGGRDSIALLHATLHVAGALGWRVAALHVHHGLMAEADDWARDVEARVACWAAEGWPVRCAISRLHGVPAPGESVEAWARRERYAALAAMARAAGARRVLLGHHRRDQAETVLLQALRGAGAAGLAAMPAVIRRGGLDWVRPWLAQPVQAIEDYVRAEGLAAAVDPSNADRRFARSRLRADVMPALREAFPDAESALAAVARHAHEARVVLAEVAHEDLRRLGAGDELPLAGWRALARARRANALRAWLAMRLEAPVPETLVQRLLDEAGDDATRRWPLDASRLLRSWRGRLAVVDPRPPDEAAPGEIALSLTYCGEHAVPGWPGVLEVREVDRHGAAPERLARVVARARSGGERFALQPAGLPRRLKKQYQAAGVAEEGRGGPLLVDACGAPLFAPGLGIDARAWAGEGAPQWALRWIARAPGDAEPV